VLNGFFVPLII